MSEQITSLAALDRWGGSFPGEHEYSTLGELNQDCMPIAAQESADLILNKWHGNKFAGLYLYGTPGTGKTHFAAALGRALIERDDDSAVAYLHLPSASEGYGGKDPFYNRSDIDRDRYAPLRIFSDHTYVDGIGSVPRARPMALILDEYRPDHRKLAIAGIEAAAEFGGLVIVTSNYSDAFKMIEKKPGPLDAQQLMDRDYLQKVSPEALKALDAQVQQAEDEVSASLRSRLAAGFRFIEFSGPDRRVENSFWA